MFVISEPSILLYYLNGGGDSFMIQMLHVALLYNYYKRQRPYDLHHTFSGLISPFGDEFSRLLRLLNQASKVRWGMVIQQDFG